MVELQFQSIITTTYHGDFVSDASRSWLLPTVTGMSMIIRIQNMVVKAAVKPLAKVMALKTPNDDED